MKRDGYSNFSYLQALPPQDTQEDTAINGVTINTKGYETVTFVVNVGANTSAAAFSADNIIHVRLEHAHESAAGSPSTWSEVYPSQMIHSVVGEDGAYSTLTENASGIFVSIDSVGGFASTVYAVGYKGQRQYCRVVVSGVGSPSIYSMGAIAILGLPANWPVNIPI